MESKRQDSKGEASKYAFGDKNQGSKPYEDDEFVVNDSDSKTIDQPKLNVLELIIEPKGIVPVEAALSLNIRFDLDQDVVAGQWSVRFLVDSSQCRVIKTLGETNIEDYPEGDSDMFFEVEKIDVNDVPPSVLSNYGLLMAVFIANGEEVAFVNMVCPQIV